jgi:hypothetical protein
VVVIRRPYEKLFTVVELSGAVTVVTRLTPGVVWLNVVIGVLVSRYCVCQVNNPSAELSVMEAKSGVLEFGASHTNVRVRRTVVE